MAQYHYVVGYDSDKDRWFVEYDPDAYFPDGYVWDDNKADEYGYGWMIPEEDSQEEALDAKCLNMLQSLVPIWPSPVVNGEL
jgi:hypothetical protein